ncbi:uncharacterized protein FOMMEDRAFT_167593 [Fomitiporia mediterranea MF3/22]|uniref:uncharacterized protein n=1 Tax=Fomitiporia mediterranea (strain MF3/22) TaxID=694068 RepID=UPI000440816D|nr:uncharacterized protein FOMMEDRAFT_167593 [Fomitiporia mediterranea MF3/22]EJD04399.1 hypothetical protein FOMMEDRAFT_167593 [Fomitiporia mediterranea MF3/22]
MSTVASGKKRPASPPTKDMFDVEIPDDVHKKLNGISKDILRVEVANEFAATKRLEPVFKSRREFLKSVPKFWPVTLMNHSTFVAHCQHADDQKALIALEDLWVQRDETERRAFKIEFHFGENPYFSDKVLVKEYKYIPPPGAKDEKPDENGVTDSQAEFDWERDVAPQKFEIQWKSDAVKLTKLNPRVMDDGEVVEAGSFFNLFEEEKDEFDIGLTIANEVFPDAIEYFTGKMDLSLTDDDDSEEDEEDDDDDADEIDLEKPEPKKQRKH